MLKKCSFPGLPQTCNGDDRHVLEGPENRRSQLSFMICCHNNIYYIVIMPMSSDKSEVSEKVLKIILIDWGGGVERHSKGLEPYLPSHSRTFSELSIRALSVNRNGSG